MTHAEMVVIAHRAMALAASPFLRYQKRGRHMVRDGVAFTRQDLPGPSFNFAAVLGPAPSLDRVLDSAREFYSGCPEGFGILVEADAGHPMEAELRGRGWQIVEDEPALVMPAISPAPLLPAGLTIRRVQSEADFRKFRHIANVAFAAPPELAENLAFLLESALDPDMAMFIGLYKGQGVATATFYLCDGIAGIAWHRIPS